ncbi:MAG: zinc ribbon domain-containing protein, partial [Anaerolineae bacterium]|nr:zinc ribbon domain-containing protein [Anaerolineae bacterium]
MYCKRCGARLQQEMIICPNCGARQRRPSRTIRCARCRGRATADMTVCPHCGRDLVPAGPRWAFWLPLAALLAFLAYRGFERLPVAQLRQGAEAVQEQLAGLVQLPPTPYPAITLTQAAVLARAVQITPLPSPTPTPT